MSKNKETAKEKREKEKAKRLKAISEKIQKKASKKSNPMIDSEEVTEVEIQELSKQLVVEEERPIKSSFFYDGELVKKEKNMLQKELESMADPEIQDIPDFLIDPEKSEERIAVMEKIKILLKHRFSLIAIADILECNSYDRLDELLEHKERIYKLVEKYSGSDGKKPIRLFAGLKRAVGDENSRVYAEQEKRMSAVIEHFSDGKYFKDADERYEQDDEKEKRNKEDYIRELIEDIVADIIDHPDFSLACQVEAEFISYEMDRASQVISSLESRAELVELLDELRTISLEADGRAYSYKVINGLVSSYSKKTKNIIDKKDDNSEEGRY